METRKYKCPMKKGNQRGQLNTINGKEVNYFTFKSKEILLFCS